MLLDAVLAKRVLALVGAALVKDIVMPLIFGDDDDKSETVRNDDKPGIELDGVDPADIGLLANDTVQRNEYGELLRAALQAVHGSVREDAVALVTVPGSKFSLGRWNVSYTGKRSNGDLEVVFYDDDKATTGVAVLCRYRSITTGTGRSMTYGIHGIEEREL